MWTISLLLLSQAASASLDTGSTGSALSGISDVASEKLNEGKGMLLKGGQPIRGHFPEVELGVLLKTMTSGRVFRGTWESSPVAIKVRLHRQGGRQLRDEISWDAQSDAACTYVMGSSQTAHAFCVARCIVHT